MKKYLFLLAVMFGSFNAFGEGVVLSDTFVDGGNEEPFVAPQTSNQSDFSGSYVSNQIAPASKSLISNDLSDPLFLVSDNQFLFDTYATIYNQKFHVGEQIEYGINDDFVLLANMLYQWDWSGKNEHGFSSTEFGGIYRMSRGNNENHIISDVLFGLKLWGSEHVRTPEYADSSYYAGLRFGRQFTGLTLAGTIKSTWIFDEWRGLSYLDFIPEAYFRFVYDWRAGIGGDIRKSTSPHLLSDQEWLNFKLLRQYGNTQYVGHFNYEFEENEILVGANIKILF